MTRTEAEIRAGLAAEPDKRALATVDEVRLQRQAMRDTMDGIQVLLRRVERSLVGNRFNKQRQDLTTVAATLDTMHAVYDENLARAEALAPETR